jgi:phosphoglycerol transferase
MLAANSRTPRNTVVSIPSQRKSGVTWVALWRAGLLVLVTALIWCAHYGKWTREAWNLPTDYAGDAPEILAQMRAAADGDIWPLRPKVIERLGAPYGAHWNAFPTPDKPLLLLVGGLTQVMGLFAAANVVLLLAPVSAALAFYFMARWLRVRVEWAWSGALLFAYTYQTFHRGLGHFSITFSWPVPLGLLAVWLVARSRRLEWRSAGALVCLGAALALGVANPYNLMFWVQLMGWAVLAQWFDRRRRANLTIGLATMALAMAVFFASNIEVWLFVQEPEGAPMIARNYAGTEMFALKPVEMLIPSSYHRWGTFASLGNRYVRWSAWRGEEFLPYLGVIGIAGLVWLGLIVLRRVFARQALPGHALSIGWLLAYSSIGGVTNVIAFLLGIQIFRATNRVAIFVSALLLIFMVVRLSQMTVAWPAWRRWAVALGLAAFGVFDQVPREPSLQEKDEIATAVNGDRRLGRELEAALPPGAMVFQLPVQGFPEVVPPHRLADYELFRPFLVTETLRFSYGAAKFRARSRWQRDLENVPTATLVRRLEAFGFAALYVNRKGFPDRAEKLLGELAALGYVRRIEGPQRQQVVVLLKPSAVPKLPMGRTLTFGRGWHPRSDNGMRWANDDAVLSYYNPFKQPITVSLTLNLVGVTPRDVTFEHGGRPIKTVRVGTVPVPLEVSQFVLPPGVNRFALRSREGAVRVSEGRYQLRTFGVESSLLKVVGGARLVE